MLKRPILKSILDLERLQKGSKSRRISDLPLGLNDLSPKIFFDRSSLGILEQEKTTPVSLKIAYLKIGLCIARDPLAYLVIILIVLLTNLKGS